MKARSFEMDINIDGESFVILVNGKYSDPRPAITNRAPEDCEPEEAGEFHIFDVECNGIDIRDVIDECGLLDEIEKYFWENEY